MFSKEELNLLLDLQSFCFCVLENDLENNLQNVASIPGAEDIVSHIHQMYQEKLPLYAALFAKIIELKNVATD